MRRFHLDPSMKTLHGVFHPIGWMLLMFPREEDARHSARVLEDNGIRSDDVLLVTPEDFRRHIAGTAGDGPLRRRSAEADTVRKLDEFARKGHCGLMVHAPRNEDAGFVTDLLVGAKISCGQRYRTLVVEGVAA